MPETRTVGEPETRSRGERVADYVAAFGGSWRFIFAAVGLISVWCVTNLTAPAPFDPYPFILLNLGLSMVAAFQAPFILMSQARAEKKQDAAYRALFAELKTLAKKNLALERQILEAVKKKAGTGTAPA